MLPECGQLACGTNEAHQKHGKVVTNCDYSGREKVSVIKKPPQPPGFHHKYSMIQARVIQE